MDWKGENGMKSVRTDRNGPHRSAFEKNKKRIYATQNVCAICGELVNFDLKYPHPLSPSVDHIIPISKGGHPSDIDNLQLAHFHCNRQKADKMFNIANLKKDSSVVGNRNLPNLLNWAEYRTER